MAEPNDAIAGQRRFRSGGTSQTERLPAALRPELVQLDGRSLPELLAYVARLSEHFLFYETSAWPTPRGSWSLSRQRSLLLLAVVADQNNVGLAQAYAAELRPLLDAAAPAGAKRGAHQRLLQLLRRQALTLIGWATAHQHSDQHHHFAEALAAMLRRAAPELREAAEREQRLRAAETLINPAVQLTSALLAQLDGLARIGEPPSTGAPAQSFPAPNNLEGDDTSYLMGVLWQLHREQTLLAGVAKQALAADLQLSNHRPELALLVAFLELYRHAQRELNDIPRRHLNHYYGEVLRTRARASVPDQTYLAFGLVAGVATHWLPAGTLVEGEDTAQQVQFATAEDAGLASWRVAALATQYVARQLQPGPDAEGPVTGIYASGWVDPDAGRGPGAAAGAGWPLFGEDQGSRKPADRTLPDARVGWALAGPALELPSGHRAITVRVQAAAASFASFRQLLENAQQDLGRAGEMLLAATFRVEVTGPEGWCPLTVQHVVLEEDTQSVCWRLALGPNQPATSGYDAACHEGNFATTWPVLRFVLNGYSPAYAYSFFAVLLPASITLGIEVDRVAAVALRNPLGEVDEATPFAPFGSQARAGDYLLIEAPELRGKNLQHVKLEFAWQHLPPQGFAAYYSGYGLPFTNDSFRISTAYRDGGRWCTGAGTAADQPLFAPAYAHSPLAATTTVRLPQLGYLDGAEAGQLRVKLVAPAAGFGADAYPTALVEAAHHNARNPKQPQPLPGPPFVLLARKLQISYGLEEVTFPSRGPAVVGTQFFHLHPFGAGEPAAGPVGLLPELPHEGTLFVGLTEEAKGQIVSVVLELTLPQAGEDGSAKRPLAPVHWAYLHQDSWVPIAPAPHLANGLAGVASSCAVEVKLPADLLPESRQLPGSLCWLRATVAAGADSFGPVRAIHTQLVRAVRVTPGLASPLQRDSLPAGILTRLSGSVPQIGTVKQPLPSFGGRPAEDEAAYYRRVSERLRHRNRPATPTDYEHLILELFPEVHSAKCLRAGQLPGKRVPGHLVLVVLPQADAVPGMTLPLFGAGKLIEMSQALQPLVSPAVQLEVRNATYELIQVRCLVIFQPPTPGENRLDYPQQLQLQLAQVLSPWRQEDPQRGGFHHHVTMSNVLAHLNRQPYVAAVTGLSLVKTALIEGTHRFYDSATAAYAQAEVRPSVPWAVLAPAPFHLLSERQGSFAPADLTQVAVTTGIGDLRVGGGFIVADPF
ncbi:MAG TPA: baseplate J/gp47 family protein [Hymenobacter sp.]|jgi:hypothetical protein|uniref:baseplate J/gp47 family protein n=1 Tax=Hymenobacter sp. TaxID=1898978 RepID=UPI002EDAFD7C